MFGKKFCSNYLWWVLSCSQNDVRCFQLFHRCFQMFLDVLDVLRCFWCSQDALKMCSDGHKSWMLDFLQIFSRCSLDVLRIFPGCSEGSCERSGSGGFTLGAKWRRREIFLTRDNYYVILHPFLKEETRWSNKKHLFNDFKTRITIASWL